MIPFNVPLYFSACTDNIQKLSETKHYSGDGLYSKLTSSWFEKKMTDSSTLLTTSCTHALEMMALLANIQPGDEVILPSYTFVSTANAFALRGARLKFVDIRPDTMNIDEKLIENAITSKTKAVVVVHYAGVACNMDEIAQLCLSKNILLFEDAAQAMMSTYKGKSLGTIGTFGTYSFHESKNFQCGEGGILIINSNQFKKQAEIIREKGTDRSAFFRGEVDKYSWISIGSSYLLSEINAAFLYGQLSYAQEVTQKRLKLWNLYNELLLDNENRNQLHLPKIPSYCSHNAHMFYIKLKNLETRTNMIGFLKNNNVNAVSHYVPLHSSKFGIKCGDFIGEDKYTSDHANRILRLPLHFDLTENEVTYICDTIKKFNFYA